MKKPKLIILDRDGVINTWQVGYVRSPQAWVPIEGSLKAIAVLKGLGIRIGVATNQSGVGRGLYTEDDLLEVHAKMADVLYKSCQVTLDVVAYCPHHPDDGCDCRKPRAGLLQRIMDEIPCRPEDTWMVGDAYTDMQAAWLVGCQAHLVRTGRGMQTLQRYTGASLARCAGVWPDLAAIADTLARL